MQTKSIFLDPTGKRQKWAARLGATAAISAAILGTLFVLSVLAVPLLPALPGLSGSTSLLKRPLPMALEERKSRLSHFLLRRSRIQLWNQVAFAPTPAPATAAQNQIVAGFYAPWQETGLQSLRANADKLTHLMPEWLHLNAQGDALDFRDWNQSGTPYNPQVVQLAREHHLQVQPILNNAFGGAFDPNRVQKLFASPQNQRALALEIRNWLQQEKFQGLNLDFENLTPQDYLRLPVFLQILGVTLHPTNLTLSIDIEADQVEAGEKTFPLRAIRQQCDFIILMAYDQHYQTGESGPIAPIKWSDQLMQQTLKTVDAQKVVLGVGNYAYDWTQDSPKPATSLTYQSALGLVPDNRPDENPRGVIDFDPDALNTTFEYKDDAGHAHEVWMLDAVSAYNQWLLAHRAGLRGAALWSLGAEDPAIWTFFDRQKMFGTLSPQGLKAVHFPYEIEFQGNGEILSVLSTPQAGARSITIDDRTGLCSDMEYERLPSSYMLQRSGYSPRTLALTFDDGPSDNYTPEILDELKNLGVPATFFVIGENAERNPNLVRRMWDEGHEIGSHTFTHPNMGTVSPRRAELELNTTQRALESILGRSTLLFRPPYSADAEPRSGEEVRPVLQAAQMGYITVGELLDPQDWNLWKRGPNSDQLPRNATDIEAALRHEVASVQGNVVLLHDGGGDRTQTIAALREFVPEMQKKGYRFVTVSQLLGKPRSAIMPVLSAKDLLLVGFDKVIFNTVFWFENVLSVGFMAAIALGIGRVVFITVLAIVAQRRRTVVAEPYREPVSVLIAAYNERPVIARTIRSILANDYPALEVLVVDDGSRDGTGDEVEREFADEPRVRLIRQANGGKAAVLNHAIAESKGEVLVCFDADTQVAPDAISLLVRQFSDEKIAAIAGNVKVGNRLNLLTRWQAIEYITSQNLDRRAYGLLNAITVVPGAIGAWRRNAMQAVGGYSTDTLAEDMDLTWRLRRAGWKLSTENAALAFTEAPDTLSAFFKQRFRWSYGTLQCLWKHRGALGRHGWFGCLALPTLWLFQFVFQVLAPLVDVQLFYALGRFLASWLTQGLLHQDWQPLPYATAILLQTGFYYALFFGLELVSAIYAFRCDRERMGLLWWLFWQRFVYRQIMYGVVWKALLMALGGMRQGWGSLQRKGTVQVLAPPPQSTSRHPSES